MCHLLSVFLICFYFGDDGRIRFHRWKPPGAGVSPGSSTCLRWSERVVEVEVQVWGGGSDYGNDAINLML